MTVLRSQLRTTESEFRTRFVHNQKLATALHERQRSARHDRPERDVARLAKQGKMNARQRLDLLLDPATPFLELSTLAVATSKGGESPGASCITGIGIVSGREVVVHVADPTSKGGAWYPLSVKKIVRALDIALENNLPVVHMCDPAGGFLPSQSAVFPDRYMAGLIFRNQALLSQNRQKQLSLVFGHCIAGGAYIPALSDYSVIVRGTGAVFLGGPPLVKAATGEIVTADELGGADLHTQKSGMCDYPADDEQDAIRIGREIVAHWSRPEKVLACETAEAPLYDPSELYGTLPDDIKKSFDMREVIARLVDGSRFHEYQPVYGKTLV